MDSPCPVTEAEWLKDGGKARLSRSPSTPMPPLLKANPRDVKRRSNSSPAERGVGGSPSAIPSDTHVKIPSLLPEDPIAEVVSESNSSTSVNLNAPVQVAPTTRQGGASVADICQSDQSQATHLDHGPGSPGVRVHSPLAGNTNPCQSNDSPHKSTGPITGSVTSVLEQPPERSYNEIENGSDQTQVPMGGGDSHGPTTTSNHSSFDSPKTTVETVTSKSEPLTQESVSVSTPGSSVDHPPRAVASTPQQRRLHALNNRNDDLQRTLAQLTTERNKLALQLRSIASKPSPVDDPSSKPVQSEDMSNDEIASVLTQAKADIKEHISLLHRYNDIRDIAQGLMGMIADQRGVRMRDVQDDFGLSEKD